MKAFSGPGEHFRPEDRVLRVVRPAEQDRTGLVFHVVPELGERGLGRVARRAGDTAADVVVELMHRLPVEQAGSCEQNEHLVGDVDGVHPLRAIHPRWVQILERIDERGNLARALGSELLMLGTPIAEDHAENSPQGQHGDHSGDHDEPAVVGWAGRRGRLPIIAVDPKPPG
jgi:hypothetical protein